MDNEAIVFVLGQTFGIFALICTVVSMQLKKKRPLMVLQTASEAFIIAQYFVTNAITGSFMSMVAFVRDIIFTKYGKKRAPLWILLTIYAVMIALVAISWSGPLSLVPCIGSMIFALSLWYGDVKLIRLGNFFGNTPYIFYTFVTGNYVLCVMTILEVIASLVGFIRIDVLKKKNSRSRKKK